MRLDRESVGTCGVSMRKLLTLSAEWADRQLSPVLTTSLAVVHYAAQQVPTLQS